MKATVMREKAERRRFPFPANPVETFDYVLKRIFAISASYRMFTRLKVFTYICPYCCLRKVLLPWMQFVRASGQDVNYAGN